MRDILAESMGRRDALVLLLTGAAVTASALVVAAVEVGERAPDFTLPSTRREDQSKPVPGQATRPPGVLHPQLRADVNGQSRGQEGRLRGIPDPQRPDPGHQLQ